VIRLAAPDCCLAQDAPPWRLELTDDFLSPCLIIVPPNDERKGHGASRSGNRTSHKGRHLMVQPQTLGQWGCRRRLL